MSSEAPYFQAYIQQEFDGKRSKNYNVGTYGPKRTTRDEALADLTALVSEARTSPLAHRPYHWFTGGEIVFSAILTGPLMGQQAPGFAYWDRGHGPGFDDAPPSTSL